MSSLAAMVFLALGCREWSAPPDVALSERKFVDMGERQLELLERIQQTLAPMRDRARPIGFAGTDA